MEATEVIEVNPLDLNNSTCYSDIRFCDPAGALIYEAIALKQIQELTGIKEEVAAGNVDYHTTQTQNQPSSETNNQPEKKKGFFARLFRKK